MALYKQDDVVELMIEAFGMDGEGIARRDGFVFFVPFAAVGEVVRAKILHVNRKNLVFCDLKEVVEPSGKRVKPVCNRFTRCGGCDLMHLTYDEQLRIKKRNVETLFRKNAVVDVAVDDVVPCSTPLGYRNKIQVPFGTVKGKVAVGFFKENSHKIVSITKCFLHGEWAETVIGALLAFAEKFGLTAYDDGTKKGLLRHLVVRRVGESTCVVVVTNQRRLPHADELTEMLREKLGDDFSLYNSVKDNTDNVILGKTMFPIRGGALRATVLGVEAEIAPYSFLQLNNEIRDKIYVRVIDGICEQAGEKIVVDAYAGVGILGAAIAKRGATVYNVEIVKEATEDGNKLVEHNGLTDRVTNINGDAAEVVPELIKRIKEAETQNKETQTSLYIILDPPRKGCEKRVLDAIATIEAPHEVYYISCNPATLTRDVKILLDHGYTLASVTPFDMFPNTRHIETLVQLSHKNPDSLS